MNNYPLVLYFLAFVPILSLLIISLIKGMKTAAVVGFFITAGLYFYWQNPFNYFSASLVSAFIVTLNIFMIILGAIFLFKIMKNTGLIEKISHSLDALHPSREIRFFLLAISLTALLEGVAGFGTPGALVPVLLISLGYNPIMSISAVLLIDSLAVTFGAVGTPILIGLKANLGLTAEETSSISFLTGILIVLASLLVFWFILKIYEKSEGQMYYKKQVFFLFLFFALPFLFLTKFIPELASILAPIIMLVLSYFYLRPKEKKLDWKSWLPYGLLIVLLLLPRIIPGLSKIINWQLNFTNLFSTTINIVFKPLVSPMFPFLFVALILLLLYKNTKSDIKYTLKKSLSTFLILFPIIAIAQLMIHSGAVYPSMVNLIAQTFSSVGNIAYLVATPFIGILGAFVSGSNTVSNIIFGGAHLETASMLGLNKNLVLSLQSTGGSLGNAICLFNIITTCAVANIKNPQLILKKNLPPILISGILISFLGIIIYLTKII